MTTHQATMPPIVARYGFASHPIIVAEFKLTSHGTDWVRTGYRKRVSGAWIRKLKAQGVTHVALSDGNRTADFSVESLLRSVGQRRTRTHTAAPHQHAHRRAR